MSVVLAVFMPAVRAEPFFRQQMPDFYSYQNMGGDTAYGLVTPSYVSGPWDSSGLCFLTALANALYYLDKRFSIPLFDLSYKGEEHRNRTWLERYNYLMEAMEIADLNFSKQLALDIMLGQIEKFESQNGWDLSKKLGNPYSANESRQQTIYAVMDKYYEVNKRYQGVLSFFSSREMYYRIIDVLTGPVISKMDFPDYLLKSYLQYARHMTGSGSLDSAVKSLSFHLVKTSYSPFDFIYQQTLSSDLPLIIKMTAGDSEYLKERYWSYHAVTVAGVEKDKGKRVLWVSDPENTPYGQGKGFPYFNNDPVPVGQQYYSMLELGEDGKTVTSGPYEGAIVELIYLLEFK